ncbi:Uu.00g079860.m01.CDS01 [Anthostomella pinea]|uniref:Uu.00g079860.m01.CDS01 n=1 Tax=Anthostomella pinea TaxID=933095 RepID=A0AAI8VKW0_9PEZI|nr:Uu.00g079860.m01.CDS01 [Anthostomella pinea]
MRNTLGFLILTLPLAYLPMLQIDALEPMSGKNDTTGRAGEDHLGVMESNHWQNTKIKRDREDDSLTYDYNQRQDEYRRELAKLYDRKHQLENELLSVQSGIQSYEALQEHLSHEQDANRARLLSERQEEDRSHAAWFAHARESSAATKANTPPESNGHLPSRGMPPPMPADAEAGGGWTSINGGPRRRSRRDDQVDPPADPGNLLSSIYHNPVEENDSPTSRAMPLRHSANRSRPSTSSHGTPPELDAVPAFASRYIDRPLKPKQERHSLPSFSAIVRSPTGRPVPEVPPEAKTKSPSARKSLPNGKGSVPPTDSPAPETNGNSLEEITRENLVLKENGSVITEPPMFAGAPLEKIDEKHPYWNPEWETVESIIQPQLDKWKERLEGLRRNPEAVRHTVFLANRQVNRGQAVIDFLKDEPFHPFQFVGKDMMAKFYKTFINYDTMFRLVNVHEELKKFDLGITPLEWLRHRMYEIAMAQGDKFNLSKMTHDLYHDAKLKYLREKHGFGNIGRPSGYKLGEKDPTRNKTKTKTKIKRESDGTGGTVRRKGRRSIGQVDPEDRPNLHQHHHHLQQQQQQQQQQPGLQGPPPEYLEPVTPRLQKRQRLEPTPSKEDPDDDLSYSGYTSTDSFSAGRIMHLDWRVYQIKSRELTTRNAVTQYWTWKQDKNKFEHQVLRDVHPKVTWGIYQKPVNFDMTLDEIIEIQYALECQKINVVLSDEKRGSMLAFFKRERTKRRFLSFGKKKGVKLVQSTAAQIEEAWDSLESQMMPNGQSEE